MAKIVPFRGIRYNLGRIHNAAGVMAPPYDVISPALQETLYRRHENNIVRLILGKADASDTPWDNRYTRAAADLQRWREAGILTRDDDPSIYLYDQEYPGADGRMSVRHGIIALSRIEDFSTGLIKPHEKTLADPKTDRLELLKACRANFSLVLALYSDPCRVLEVLAGKEKVREPEVAVQDDDGIWHRLWRCADASLIGKAQAVLDNKSLVLADGHHRYEAAIGFRDFMRERHPDYTGKELFNYMMMCFTNMEDPGLRVFPTHRVVSGLPGFELARFLRELETCFDVETHPFAAGSAEERLRVRRTLAEKGADRHVLALFAGAGAIHYLSLKDEKLMDGLFDGKTPKVLRTLDVSILHRLILETVLKLTPEQQEKPSHLQYVKGFDEPFQRVERGAAQLAFLMNPTRVGEVRDVANAGEKMPQKSTYFYPQLLTGLVMNRLD